MAGLGDIVKRALYLGVGLASYAGEKAGGKLAELQVQAQKLADEMVARGEMTTEEARRFVDDFIKQAQQPISEATPAAQEEPKQNNEPRRIEIISEEEDKAQGEAQDVEAMRRQVQALQDELRNLKRK